MTKPTVDGLKKECSPKFDRRSKAIAEFNQIQEDLKRIETRWQNIIKRSGETDDQTNN